MIVSFTILDVTLVTQRKKRAEDAICLLDYLHYSKMCCLAPFFAQITPAHHNPSQPSKDRFHCHTLLKKSEM